jgi:cytochrome c
MEDRFNTIAGWTLFSGIVALGLSSLSGHYFRADKHHAPEKAGYELAGAAAEGGETAAVVPLETLLASADPAKGEKSFGKCLSCHNATQGGANGTGPNLYGVLGRPIGKGAAGFGYSAAIAAHGGNWDFAALNTWLTKPGKMVEGTAMNFAGLPDAQERANLIAYLNTQGSNLPLPAAAAAPVEGAAPAEGAAAPAASEVPKK